MNRNWAYPLALLVAACSSPLSDVNRVAIQGTVRSTLTGSPVTTARVIVIVDRGVFGRTPVGTASTDAAGRFWLTEDVSSGDCGFVRLFVEAVGYRAAPSAVAVFGQSVGCGSRNMALQMDPAVISVSIAPTALTVPAGGRGELQARAVFHDGYAGLAPALGDTQGTLWSVLGNGVGATCGHMIPDLGANPATYQAPAVVPGDACGAGSAGSVLIALRVEHGGSIVWDSIAVAIGP